MSGELGKFARRIEGEGALRSAACSTEALVLPRIVLPEICAERNSELNTELASLRALLDVRRAQLRELGESSDSGSVIHNFWQMLKGAKSEYLEKSLLLFQENEKRIEKAELSVSKLLEQNSTLSVGETENIKQELKALIKLDSLLAKLNAAKAISALAKDSSFTLSEESVAFAKNSAAELRALSEQPELLETLTAQQERLNAELNSGTQIPTELRTLFAQTLKQLDAAKALFKAPETTTLLKCLEDRSLIRSGSLENYFYYDFIPFAVSVGAGAALTYATGGGYLVCLFGMGIAGLAGTELTKELQYLAAGSNSRLHSSRSLLLAAKEGSEIAGEKVSASQAAGQYLSQIATSAIGAGSAQLAAIPLSQLISRGLSGLASSQSTRLLLPSVQRFAENRLQFALSEELKTLASLQKTEAKTVFGLIQRTCEELGEEMSESLLEQAFTQAQIQFGLGGFKELPFLSPITALLIALRQSPSRAARAQLNAQRQLDLNSDSPLLSLLPDELASQLAQHKHDFPDFLKRELLGLPRLIPSLAGLTALLENYNTQQNTNSSAQLIEYRGRDIEGREVFYRFWPEESWRELQTALSNNSADALTLLPESVNEPCIINLPLHTALNEQSFRYLLAEEQGHIRRGLRREGTKLIGSEFSTKLFAAAEAGLAAELTAEQILTEVLRNYNERPAETAAAIRAAKTLVPDLNWEQIPAHLLEQDKPLKPDPLRESVFASKSSLPAMENELLEYPDSAELFAFYKTLALRDRLVFLSKVRNQAMSLIADYLDPEEHDPLSALETFLFSAAKASSMQFELLLCLDFLLEINTKQSTREHSEFEEARSIRKKEIGRFSADSAPPCLSFCLTGKTEMQSGYLIPFSRDLSVIVDRAEHPIAFSRADTSAVANQSGANPRLALEIFKEFERTGDENALIQGINETFIYPAAKNAAQAFTRWNTLLGAEYKNFLNRVLGPGIKRDYAHSATEKALQRAAQDERTKVIGHFLAHKDELLRLNTENALLPALFSILERSGDTEQKHIATELIWQSLSTRTEEFEDRYYELDEESLEELQAIRENNESEAMLNAELPPFSLGEISNRRQFLLTLKNALTTELKKQEALTADIEFQAIEEILEQGDLFPRELNTAERREAFALLLRPNILATLRRDFSGLSNQATSLIPLINFLYNSDLGSYETATTILRARPELSPLALRAFLAAAEDLSAGDLLLNLSQELSEDQASRLLTNYLNLADTSRALKKELAELQTAEARESETDIEDTQFKTAYTATLKRANNLLSSLYKHIKAQAANDKDSAIEQAIADLGSCQQEVLLAGVLYKQYADKTKSLAELGLKLEVFELPSLKGSPEFKPLGFQGDWRAECERLDRVASFNCRASYPSLEYAQIPIDSFRKKIGGAIPGVRFYRLITTDPEPTVLAFCCVREGCTEAGDSGADVGATLLESFNTPLEAQGSGFGRRFMDEMLQAELQRKETTPLRLLVWSRNTAIPLYEEMGFQRTGETIAVADTGETAIFMERNRG